MKNQSFRREISKTVDCNLQPPKNNRSTLEIIPRTYQGDTEIPRITRERERSGKGSKWAEDEIDQRDKETKSNKRRGEQKCSKNPQNKECQQTMGHYECDTESNCKLKEQTPGEEETTRQR